MKLRGLGSNIRKYFLVLFTARRNFIPILSIYFLTLPNSTAQQIGMYTAAGYIVGLIFQIPAGYRGDKRGNKTTLVISKLCLLVSSLCYVIGGNFRFFLVGAIFNSVGGDSFATGNASAFLHDTLSAQGRADRFKKISSSIRGWVSLVSVFFIIALPFLTSISMKFPFIIGLGIDVIGLIVAFSLFPVRSPNHTQNNITIKNIIATIKKTKKTGFYSLALFAAIIGAFLMADGVYRTPYLQELGYPIAFIGFVMGGSRLVRFLVGQYAHKLEKILPLKQLMFVEIFLFVAYYISASYLTNPYLIGIIFSLVIGYFRGRSDIYTDYLIKLLPEPQYKSTMLSLKSQVGGIIQSLLVFCIGFVMTRSYSTGFLILGISLFVVLGITYGLFLRETKNNSLKTPGLS